MPATSTQAGERQSERGAWEVERNIGLGHRQFLACKRLAHENFAFTLNQDACWILLSMCDKLSGAWLASASIICIFIAITEIAIQQMQACQVIRIRGILWFDAAGSALLPSSCNYTAGSLMQAQT